MRAIRATRIGYLQEIATLAEGIEILTGVATERLYVPVVNFPVRDADSDSIVGHFTFDSVSEQIVFRPTIP